MVKLTCSSETYINAFSLNKSLLHSLYGVHRSIFKTLFPFKRLFAAIVIYEMPKLSDQPALAHSKNPKIFFNLPLGKSRKENRIDAHTVHLKMCF
jgi:hypothetical protein